MEGFGVDDDRLPEKLLDGFEAEGVEGFGDEKLGFEELEGFGEEKLGFGAELEDRVPPKLPPLERLGELPPLEREPPLDEDRLGELPPPEGLLFASAGTGRLTAVAVRATRTL